MRKQFFRMCSLILTVVLLVNMLPMSIFAEEFQEAQAAAAIEEAAKVTDAQVVAEVEEKRTEYSKQFKLDNGLFVAAVYAEPVHYLEDGQWVEIDNTLKAASDDTYTNTAGVWDVSLPGELTGKTPITITKDGHTLSFQMAGELNGTGELQTAEFSLESAKNPFSVSGTKNTKGEVKKIDFTTAKKSAEHEEFVLEKNTSQILYADVYENTDVQYDLQGNRVKESIIIDSYSSDLRGYRYILKTGQMVPVLNDDGSIHFCDKEENVVMVMPAPYLIDNNEEYNDDIQVSLEGNDGTYTLSYVLPQEWLAAEDRAWPVVLDPEVNADFSRTNIIDQGVSEFNEDSLSVNILECGYGPSNHNQRFYVKYAEIPYLTSSDVIVEAKISLYKPKSSGTRTSVVEVHKVLDTWGPDTLSWNNQPEIDPMVEDFKIAGSYGTYTWEVTDLVRGWYTGENTGMVFKVDATAEASTAASWQQFYSSECAWNTNRPYLVMTFRNNNGIEDHWDYSTASAGRAGTGYVNTYTGNLTWIRSDLGFGGNLMPVSISHTYNLNDSENNTYGMGYGWRTNFNQKVYSKTISDDTFYVWEDGDGTDHYFEYIAFYGNYKDENGQGLTLKTNGSGDKQYSIADRQGNTTYFDANGRMTYQENNQKAKSSIKLTYTDTTGNLIDYIKDGADRTYDFIYEDGNLSGINYLGTGTEPIHTVEFAYTDGNLTQVSYADEEDCCYTYDQNRLLTSASDIDGYKLEYTFSDKTADYQPYRVTSVTESCDGILGGGLTFEYAHNQTTLTDHNGNVEIMQFNNFGNTICIQDDEGRAQYSQYAVNDASETGKANQLRLSSRLQNTVSDWLYDGGFERDHLWTVSFGSGTRRIFDKTDNTNNQDNADKLVYMGNKSLEITNDVILYDIGFNLEPGKTCTFSGYVKTETANVRLRIYDGTNTLESTTQTITNSDWVRLEVSYTNNSDNTAYVAPQIVTSGTGKTYVDCLQMEMNATASRYNLVDNGDFRYLGQGWKVGNEQVSDENIIGYPSAADQLSDIVYHTFGTPREENRISQEVTISGEKGDTFVLTGWAKGDAVPTPKESNESKQRYYGIVAKFNYKDTSKKSKTYVAKFNPDTDSTVNWQYSAEMMVAEYPYSSITVYIAYDRSANEAWFDGIQLFKEEFGQSYTYNDDGDVIAVKDVQGKNTDYTYDSKGNILKAKQDGTTLMSYTYDSYSNVLTSTSAEGLKQEYTYDDYGNNLSVTIVDGNNPKITTTSVYTEDGNRLANTTDALGRTTFYCYNADTNVLEWTLYPEDLNAYENNNQVDTKTYYSYDNMFRMTGTAARVDTGTTLFANYFYENDYLKYIQTASTIYTFNNNDFGLRSEVKAGDHTLASYNYVDEDLQEGEVERNYYLQSLDYGNGDKVEYDYDDKGRMLSQTYEDGETVTYHYDNYGALASVTDSIPDPDTDSTTERTTTYYYDFTDRLIKYVESGEDYNHSLSYEYDDKNRLKSTTELLGEDSYTYSYTYDKDDRTSAITLNDAQRAYTFDKYGRTHELITNYITKTTDDEGKETETATQVKKDTYTFTPFQDKTSSQIASHTVYFGEEDSNGNYTKSVEYVYTYDENGNITSISKKLPSASEQELIASYEYDTANQLIRENNKAGNFTYTWTYDYAGNIKTRTEYAYTTGNLGTVIDTISYGYDDSQSGWGDLLISYGGQTISYDENHIGNPKTDGVRNYTWKHGRQLASLSIGGVTWDYTYNVDGLRTSKTNGTTTYNYTYTGDKLTCMTVGDNSLYFAYDASGVPMSVTYNDVTYYYVTNVQGDVIALVNSFGAEVASYAYDAWGNPITIPQTDSTETQTNEIAELNPLRYRGYVYDEETSLYYLQSRYYNPEIGRFINADAQLNTSLGTLGMNTFSYCLNNPINLVDYAGRKPGELFSTVDEAAIDACLYMGPDSFSNSWEYGTVIYCVETTIYVRCRRIYTYRKSDGSMGKVARIDIVEKKVIRYTYSVVRTDNNEKLVHLPLPPEGHARAGFVHTHPTGAGRGVTMFSPADQNFAKNYMRPIYAYGPNGHIIKYDPVMDEVIPIGEDFPKSPYLDSFLEG